MKCGRISLELISWGRDSSFERERKVRRHLLTFSINREIRHFHVVVVQWRQRNVQKSVMHVQSCCFAHQTYRVFSLTWSASMQIYWNKRKRLHKKRVQLPQDWFGTPTWPSFHCFGTPIWPPWRHVKTLYCFFFFAVLVAVAVVVAKLPTIASTETPSNRLLTSSKQK